MISKSRRYQQFENEVHSAFAAQLPKKELKCMVLFSEMKRKWLGLLAGSVQHVEYCSFTV